ncbi:FABP family protein [Ilumatobacter sp.]|uniref:FABP family protein n=1 Tax=Ilumatobacter sp. TaxID=1967498 RepID=UPI003B5241FC
MVPPLHPDLTPLEALVGTWSGEGEGEYPTIETFRYVETITFEHVGTPVLAYRQRTTAADDGRPLHAEAGYLRVPAPGTAELVIAHPTGVTEVLEGFAAPNSAGPTDTVIVDVRSRHVGLTTTAKHVERVERTWEVTGDVVRCTVRMSAVGQPLLHHLAATLRRA